MTPLQRLGVADGLLAVLAVLGFGLFALALPQQHPDAAADYGLGEEAAVASAAAFVAESGHGTDDLVLRASFRRLPALLDSLQQDLGRPAAIRVLQGEAGRRLPGYYWHVGWYRAGDEDGPGSEEGDDPLISVSLNKAGEVWAFSSPQDRRPVDRAALRSALFGEARAAGQEPSLPAALSDSLFAASIAFGEEDSLWVLAPAAGPGAFDGAAMLAELEAAPAAYRLGPDWAVVLARHHLSRTALASFRLRVDSTWLARPPDARTGASTAWVRFVSEEPYQGQTVQAEVRVAPAGGLGAIETQFNSEPRRVVRHLLGSGEEAARPADDEGSHVTLSVSARDVAGILKGLTYAVLVILFLLLFFRRLNARVIDARAAMRDAFWGGLFFGVVVALVAGPEIAGSMPGLWAGLVTAGIVSLMAAVAGALPIFLISSATDSIVRESWPEKLDTWSLVRQVALRNVPVGLALLRGVALAGVMLGLIMLGLLALPDAVLRPGGPDPDQFLSEHVLSPAGYLFSSHAYGSLFISLLVLLGVGTLVYRRKAHAAVVVPVLVLVLVLMQAGPLQVEPLGYQWTFAGFVGVVLAVGYWRYDALTCFVAYLFMNVLWGTAPGWLVEGLPERIDAVAALVLVALALGFGLVGLWSGRTGEEIPRYVPVYIEDLAHQERLKRELEIAHQVQASFLPRRMPEIEGLDIAAMCLAAQEVGGDYFDFVEVEPGRLAVVVGDVSGKGIQAAFYMTLIKGFVQTLCRTVNSPAEVLRRLNALFYENAPRGTFVSLIYGVVDVEARTFTFARAGHNPVILKRSPSQEPALVRPAGMAVGLVNGPRFDDTMDEVTLHLRPGDVLVFYTDGFSEAMNASKEQYGDHRLARKVGDAGGRSAIEILRAVTEDVHHFLEAVGRHDDMTMVVVKLSRRTDYLSAFTAQQQRAVRA